MVHPAPNLQKALSQKFRADQAQVGNVAGTAAGMIFNSGFSIKQARDSWVTIRPQIIKVVDRYYLASQESGKVYYNACRMASGLGPVPPSMRAKPLSLTARSDKTVDSTGLGWFLHEVKGGAQMMDAFTSAHDLLTSAVAALVMDGARDWIEMAAGVDPDAEGIRRVTRGTCEYCESLADEGVTVSNQGWHNDCECTSEPAFSDRSASPSLPDSGVRSAPGSNAVDLLDVADDITDTSTLTGQVEDPMDKLVQLSKSKNVKVRNKALAALAIIQANQEDDDDEL